MIIVYSSNTGYTEQYAKLLQNELDIPAYRLEELPPVHEGANAIYLGWLMAGSVVGYKKAVKKLNVKCVIGVGMSPESDEQTASIAEKCGAASGTKVFYLQGGYDKKKLKGINKGLMSVVEKKILGKFEGMAEEEKKNNPTYLMVTQGYSVVSKDRLADVIAWYQENK